MEFLIELECKLSDAQKKYAKVKYDNFVTGYYTYHDSKIHINASSVMFKICETDNDIIKLFTEVCTHEVLHHIIFTITKSFANTMEEYIVDKISKVV